MHRARKRFGQNFLHDKAVIARIVAAIHPQAGEALVEIGPGLGALTRELLPRVDALDVVELDRDVIPLLEQACVGLGTLCIHQADALHFNFTALMRDERKLRIVGNLPYNIATPLLFHLFSQTQAIRDMHFMLQKEVVERMVAAPNTEHYGRLSVMVQFHCTAHKLFTVGPGAFKPEPKVDSAIVRLLPHAVPPVAVNDVTQFSLLVAQAFSQRRKTVRNALKGTVNDAQFSICGIDPGARAEQLTLADFAGLSRAL
ncbi:MAG: 16S rRNA (adenine(1518)-N(6)/adenine(1519)-N(6))-dimethyltransferase RsmA [Gammaproteobacteria bacterium]|nr:16S rRNA (adenine(1518)-N(6)/adenine(1519)-N(6))-dimethyltransferase RsmA [Gammaproteobacteria bacterium]